MEDAASQLSALIDSTDNPIWAVNLDYQLIAFNASYRRDIKRLFGVPIALGMQAADYLPSERANLWPPIYRRALSEGPFRIEYPLVDGRTAELAINPMAQDGRQTGVSVFSKDITRQKATEQALKEAEKKYRDIFEGALEGFYRTSPEGRNLVANPALARMLGYDSPDEVVSTVLDSAVQVWLDPNDRARCTALLEEQGTVRGFECQYKRKDGSPLWVSLSSRRVEGPDGRTLYYEGFIEDITERKRMEDAIRKSEQTFSSVFRANPAAMSINDLEEDSRFVDVNEAFERITGHRREEVIGLTVPELGLWADPYDRENIRDLLQRDGKLRNVEHRFRRKNGEIGSGLLSIEILPLGGKPHAVVAMTDITERIRMADALSQSEQKFAKAFRASPASIGIADLSAGGRLIDVNEAWERGSGYSRDEAIGRSAKDLGLILDPLRFDVLYSQLPVTGSFRNAEFQFRRKDGEVRTALVSSEYIELDGKPCAISTTVDITERIRAEEEIRSNEERLQLTLEANSEGVWDWNISSGEMVFSPGYCRMLGYQPHEFGRDFHALRGMVHPDDGDRVDRALKEHFAAGTPYRVELRMQKQSGEWVWILSRGTVVEKDAEGRPVRMVGTHVEITRRKRAEEDKLKLEEQLRHAQRMESVGRLAGGVAHDFNNLLTVINGYSALLLKELPPGERAWTRAREIGKAGERAAGLTMQLLAFSRKQVLQPSAVDLNAIVRDMERMLTRLIGEDIQVVTTLAAGLGQVMADPDRIHQVLMNLVVNARDAMPNGGKLHIQTRNVDGGELAAAAHPEAAQGACVLVSVSDSGVGMNRETLQRVFEPFFTTKAPGKGTGLGLSTVYGIVKQSGGWIDVMSEPGAGTTFRIYLPRIGAGQVTDGLASAEPEKRGGETVLVVEDQDPVRQFTTIVLESYGYKVLEAAEGQQALALSGSHSGEIHLLLTDVVLPGMNGREVSDRLRALRPNLKTLFMSGYTADAVAHRGVLDSGVVYLQKPFSPEKLAERIREVLAAGA